MPFVSPGVREMVTSLIHTYLLLRTSCFSFRYGHHLDFDRRRKRRVERTVGRGRLVDISIMLLATGTVAYESLTKNAVHAFVMVV